MAKSEASVRRTNGASGLKKVVVDFALEKGDVFFGGPGDIDFSLL